MRYSSESSQTREKEADVETALDPEAIEDVGSRWGSDFKIKHKHTDVTWDHECRRLTGSEAQTETNNDYLNNNKLKPNPNTQRNNTISALPIKSLVFTLCIWFPPSPSPHNP